MAEQPSQEWPECFFAGSTIYNNDSEVVAVLKEKFPDYEAIPFRFCSNENAAGLWGSYTTLEERRSHPAMIKLAEIMAKSLERQGRSAEELFPIPPDDRNYETGDMRRGRVTSFTCNMCPYRVPYKSS